MSACEELPKWLKEAKAMGNRTLITGSNRSLGSNYLDTYLSNLTQHSWLSYAPTTPVHGDNSETKRVFILPEVFYNKKIPTKNKLFMSHSFTEGMSMLDDDKVLKSMEHGGVGPPSSAAESGVNTDLDTDRSGRTEKSGRSGGPSATLDSPTSESTAFVANSVNPDESVAVDSLETDAPVIYTETSGVITHETETLSEVADDEPTISENFPDIPYDGDFRTQYARNRAISTEEGDILPSIREDVLEDDIDEITECEEMESSSKISFVSVRS